MKRQLVREGVSLSYLDEGAGPALLLLHGFPLDGRSFRPQVEALSRRARLIVPDHRGFGDSAVGPGGPTEMHHIADDAVAILDALGIEQAVVGGVSMGGYAAMALLRHHPRRVRALVLIDTQAFADDEAGKQRRRDNAQAARERGTAVLLEAMMPKLLDPAASPALRAEVEAMIRKASPEGAANASLGMGLRPDSHELLAGFGQPALIMVGERDVITPPEKSEAMANRMSGARLVRIPGAGHLSNIEAPAETQRALEAFLGGILPRSGA
jgi:pimeloyl-ACP methyl ester carboxylesterase